MNNHFEQNYPITTNPALFVRKKAVAVMFGDERINVKSWRGVYKEVITRCYESPENHKMLMWLRDKTGGKIRTFISKSPDGMSRAMKIADDVYCEVHYGSQTLMWILVEHLLKPARFNLSDVRVVFVNRK